MSILDDNILEETSIIENILNDFPDLQDVKYTVNNSYIPSKLTNYVEWYSKYFKSILSHEMDTVRLEWYAGGDSALVIRFLDSKSNNYWMARISKYSEPMKNLDLAIDLLNEMKEHVLNISRLLDFFLEEKELWFTEGQVRDIIG